MAQRAKGERCGEERQRHGNDNNNNNGNGIPQSRWNREGLKRRSNDNDTPDYHRGLVTANGNGQATGKMPVPRGNSTGYFAARARAERATAS